MNANILSQGIESTVTISIHNIMKVCNKIFSLSDIFHKNIFVVNSLL